MVKLGGVMHSKYSNILHVKFVNWVKFRTEIRNQFIEPPRRITIIHKNYSILERIPLINLATRSTRQFGGYNLPIVLCQETNYLQKILKNDLPSGSYTSATSNYCDDSNNNNNNNSNHNNHTVVQTRVTHLSDKISSVCVVWNLDRSPRWKPTLLRSSLSRRCPGDLARSAPRFGPPQGTISRRNVANLWPDITRSLWLLSNEMRTPMRCPAGSGSSFWGCICCCALLPDVKENFGHCSLLTGARWSSAIHPCQVTLQSSNSSVM